MTRVPSIHITENQLTAVLEDLTEDFQDDPDFWFNYKFVAKKICEKAKATSITHRGISVTNDKLLKKSKQLETAGRTDTGVFSELLVLIRRKFKHRGIAMVKPGEADWLYIKELTGLANEFCNEFGLKKKDGYKEYITLAMEKMKKYSLNKFKSLHPSIFTTYEAILQIKTDKTPSDTEEAWRIYLSIINSRIGHTYEDYKHNPEKYVCFKKAKDEAAKMKLKVKQYITAQFEALEWANAIPDPFQLYGEKAIERARKYCYTHNIQLTAKHTIDFSKIKKKHEKH